MLFLETVQVAICYMINQFNDAKEEGAGDG